MVWPTRESGFAGKTTTTWYSCNKPNILKRMWWHVTGQAGIKRLEQLGGEYLERYMERVWIENDETGFTGWRWDKFNVELRLVCAANRYKDIIVTGPRHYSNIMFAACEAFGGTELLRKYAGDDGDIEQGFIDQYGTFYNRVESMAIALKQGQLLYPENCPGTDLFSEGLY